MKSIGFNCRYCHFIFWTKEKLNEHQLSRHSEHLQDSYLLCSLCFSAFNNLVSEKWRERKGKLRRLKIVWNENDCSNFSIICIHSQRFEVTMQPDTLNFRWMIMRSSARFVESFYFPSMRFAFICKKCIRILSWCAVPKRNACKWYRAKKSYANIGQRNIRKSFINVCNVLKCLSGENLLKITWLWLMQRQKWYT